MIFQILAKKPYLKKSVALLVASTFIFSNIALAEAAKTDNAAAGVQKPQEVVTDPERIVIPRDYGLVKSKYEGKDKRLIVHVQDAHCNYEAQSNIAKILETLIKNDGLKFVSVEGADGIIDTSWFKAFPDADIRKEVADYFMKKGEITGAEFLSITTDYPIKLFGAETRSYYIENLNAFTSSYPLKEEVERYFNQIKAILNKLKTTIYSAELKDLDAKTQDYEAKKLQFADYVKTLEAMAVSHKINLRQYDSLFKLISVFVYEKKINFNIVDKERSTLIDEITKKLDKEALEDLVTKSLSFKISKISSVEYYDYLRKLASHHGFDLATDYPNLFNYIIYNSVYSRIENEKLFKDLKDLELAIKEKLFANDDQRTLEKLSRHIDILLGLTNIKLLNGDFDYYKSKKDEFGHESFAGFINKMAAKYGFSFELDSPSDAVTESIPKLEDFYSIAIKRDKALVDNTLKAMKKEGVQACVLITGGFHSEGIARMLESQGISYMVVCPNITKEVETPYIKILTNQRTPLEEILADTAQEPKAKSGSMLAPILLTWAGPLDERHIRKMLSESQAGADLKKLVDGIAERIINARRGWKFQSVKRWIAKTMKEAQNRRLLHDLESMKEAYIFAMRTGLIDMKTKDKDGKALTGAETKAIDRFVDELTKSDNFENAFTGIYDEALLEYAAGGQKLAAKHQQDPDRTLQLYAAGEHKAAMRAMKKAVREAKIGSKGLGQPFNIKDGRYAKTVGGTLSNKFIGKVISKRMVDPNGHLVIFENGKIPASINGDPKKQKYAQVVQILKDAIDNLNTEIFSYTEEGEFKKQPRHLKKGIFRSPHVSGDHVNRIMKLIDENILKDLLKKGSKFKVILIEGQAFDEHEQEVNIPNLRCPAIALTPTGSNYGHYSIANNCIYLPWAAIDKWLDIIESKDTDNQSKEIAANNIASDSMHESVEYKALIRAFPAATSPVEHFDIEQPETIAHYIAQYMEIEISGASPEDQEFVKGPRSLFDDELDQMTEGYLERAFEILRIRGEGISGIAINEEIEIQVGGLYREGMERGSPSTEKDGSIEVMLKNREGRELHIKAVKSHSGKEEVDFCKIGNRTYQIVGHIINLSNLFRTNTADDILAWIGNKELLDFFRLSPRQILTHPFHPENIAAMPYLWDALQEPISRIAQPEICPYNVLLKDLEETRHYLKSIPYNASATFEELITRLHYLFILSRSNIEVVKDYVQVLEDIQIVTQDLVQMAMNDNIKVRDLSRAILNSIGIAVVRAPATDKAATSALKLTPKEIKRLKEKTPFIIETAEDFDRLRHITERQISKGDCKPYVLINIKNFSETNFISYVKFVSDISKKFNGNITFILSIENPRSLRGDLAGNYTARRRAIDIFGDEFWQKSRIITLPDGGEKTRAANAGVLVEQWSKALTSDGVSFLEDNILTACATWFVLPKLGMGNKGQNYKVWLASDGRIRFGRVNLAKKPLSDIPDDLQLAVFGLDALVMSDKQRDFIKEEVLKEAAKEEKSFEDVFMSVLRRILFETQIGEQIRLNIDKRELIKRGIFVTDEDGVMPKNGFLEKGGDKDLPAEERYLNIAVLAYRYGGVVFENLWLIIEDSRTSLDITKRFATTPTSEPSEEHYIGRVPEVSVFQEIAENSLATDRPDKSNRPWAQQVKKALTSGKIYGVSYGEGVKAHDIASLENYFVMWEEYVRSYKGPKEVDVDISPRVTITYRGDKKKLKYLLKNVKIRGKGELEIGDGVVIHGGTISIKGKQVITDRSKIIDSLLLDPVDFVGEAAVLLGVRLDFDRHVLIDRGARLYNKLVVYGDETTTTQAYNDGTTHVVRLMNSFDYKKDTKICDLVGGKDRWQSIRKDILGLYSKKFAEFDDVFRMPLDELVNSEDKWKELVYYIFTPTLSAEELSRVANEIANLAENFKNRNIDKDTYRNEMSDSIRSAVSARFTTTNRDDFERDIVDIGWILTGFSPRKYLEDAIKHMFENRVKPQIDSALQKVHYEDIKNEPYGKGLYRILAVMHPAVIENVDHGPFSWDNVSHQGAEKSFYDLPLYGGERYHLQAKAETASSEMLWLLDTRRTPASTHIEPEYFTNGAVRANGERLNGNDDGTRRSASGEKKMPKSAIEEQLEKAMNGDKAAHEAIESIPVKDAIAYFESCLPEAKNSLLPSLFGVGRKPYDIRGVALDILKADGSVQIPANLDPQKAYLIGKMLGTQVAKEGGKALLTADMRIHGQPLVYALGLGLMSTGIDIIYSPDIVPTGAHNLLVAENPYGCDIVVQTSGSHNPIEFNGFKIKARRKSDTKLRTVYAESLSALYGKYDFRKPAKLGKKKKLEPGVIRDFVIDILDKTLPTIEKDEIVVVDSKAGATGEIQVGILKKRGFAIIDMDELTDMDSTHGILNVTKSLEKELTRRINDIWGSGKAGTRRIAVVMNTKPDGRMPRGIWDPGKAEAREAAVALVNLINKNLLKDMPYAFGVVLDGDGDRITTILESGKDVPTLDMYLAYYQRFLKDKINHRVLVELAKAGLRDFMLTCDVRSNTKLHNLINEADGAIKEGAGIRKDDEHVITGYYITTGYPPQMSFVEYRMKQLRKFVEEHPKLKKNAAFMEDLGHFGKTFFTAESSGHNFFHTSSSFPEDVLDDGIAGFITLMHIRETMGECEGPLLGIEPTEKGYTLENLYVKFPTGFSTDDLRVRLLPKQDEMKRKIATDLGDWLKETFKTELKPITEVIEEGEYYLQSVRSGFVTVAGFKAQLKDGRAVLIRWSESGPELSIMVEGFDWQSTLSLISLVRDRLLKAGAKEDSLKRVDEEMAWLQGLAARQSATRLEDLKGFKAYPNRFVDNPGIALWVPTQSLSAPLEPRSFGDITLPQRIDGAKLRSQEDMLLFVAQNFPEVLGMQRFIDVGGSSIDLRALQKLLTKLGVNALDFLTSTTIVAGDFPLSLKVGVASDVDGFLAKDVIQYAIDYKKWENGEIVDKTKTYTVVRKDEKIYTLMENGTLRPFLAERDETYEIWGEKDASRMQKRKAGQVIDGQMGAFAYFLSRVGAFGLKGNFRTLQPVAEAGGLGRSGGSNAMFIAMAGVIAGAELTKADVQAEAVEKEGNGEDDALALFGGYTGGQESGATLQGGASQMIHLTEVKDESGNYVWPVGTELVIPLTGSLEEADQRILSHVALVQVGLPFENGAAMIKRTAGGINTTWCERAKHAEDIKGRELHAAKTLVAMAAAYGIAHDQWDLVIWSQNEHRRLRNELDKGFYDFALQALEGKPDRPAFADRYLQILRDDPILNRYLQYHINGKDESGKPFDLRKVSLYSMTSEPLIAEVTRIVREITGKNDMQLTDIDSPAAVFIPGAGGTGSPAVIITKTPELLKDILERIKLENREGKKVKLKQFSAEDVLKVMGGTGLLQGYLQPTAGKPIEFKNLPAGTKPLRKGYSGIYDQKTGIYYLGKDKTEVPAEVLALPRVRILSECGDIEAAYAAQKLQMQSASGVAEKLHTALDARGNAEMAARFLKGGYKQDGYGVEEGAAVDGSFAIGTDGNQGYYVDRTNIKGPDGKPLSGKEVFVGTVDAMKKFFAARAERNGKPIRYVIKPGIGGQHTPFQGIADSFEVVDNVTGKIVGEYELGKDYESALSAVLKELNADWDQIAVIPNSKSGSTDETMIIFSEVLYVMLKNIAAKEGIDGEKFAQSVFKTMHDVNFIDGTEQPGKDLFKGFTLNLVRDRAKADGLDVTYSKVRTIFGKVLGNMFFETTDRPEASRLSAFIRNSGLGKELGVDAPGFGAMFDNVGGRWTADLHMMTFLAYHNLNAEEYWQTRYSAIKLVREGKSAANMFGNKIVDEGITDIALVVPDELFWFGKAMEQNFNESIWQKGFTNLIAVKKSLWDDQSSNYANKAGRLVINISDLDIQQRDGFNLAELAAVRVKDLNKQQLANLLGNLFTAFYGMTHTVGNRLISTALAEKGYSSSDIDISDLDNPATKIVQENLYVRQPFVELGKGLLEERLKGLQERRSESPRILETELEAIKEAAKQGILKTNLPVADMPDRIRYSKILADTVRKAAIYAKETGRKFVPMIYLEGGKFYDIRDYLISLGVEWVMQGTGDQHISYQQVLSQPRKYLPFIISFVPEKTVEGRPAIGFAKGYLDNVSPNMVRDYFAEASYQALTELRKDQGGLGLFLRLVDSDKDREMLKAAFAEAVSESAGKVEPAQPEQPSDKRLSSGGTDEETGAKAVEKPISQPAPKERREILVGAEESSGPVMTDNIARPLSTEEIDSYVTRRDIEALEATLFSLSANREALVKDGKVMIVWDTDLDGTGPTAQKAQKLVEKYLGDAVVNVRGKGEKLLRNAQAAAAADQFRSVVVIAGNRTLATQAMDGKTVGDALQALHEKSKVLNVQSEDAKGNRLFVQVPALYNLALAIGYDMSQEKVMQCLQNIGVVIDGNGNPIDPMALLTEKIVRILLRIRPIDIDTDTRAQVLARKALERSL